MAYDGLLGAICQIPDSNPASGRVFLMSWGRQEYNGPQSRPRGESSGQVLGAFEIDVNMIAVRIMQIDLDNGKARDRINAVFDAAIVEFFQESRHVSGAKGEMFQRHVAT